MLYIVRCFHFEGQENVLFLMKDSDSRFGGPEYATVTPGKWTKERAVVNGFRVRVFLGDDGIRYGIFPDWSARVV